MAATNPDLVAISANTNTLSAGSGQAGSLQGGDRAAQSISVGGNRIMFDYFTLDGATNTDPDFSTYVMLPSIDAIQEFKVQTGIYESPRCVCAAHIGRIKNRMETRRSGICVTQEEP